jgi:dephospho-CoA kinase
VTRPVAVAITGGIGAGKSEALAAFRRNGAATVSSDEIVHELLLRDDVREVVRQRFGNGVVNPADGHLDRGAIASVVFADREALDWLEALLHPLVAAEYLTWREQLAGLREPPRVCVTEVPLLYETGAEGRFDRVVVITAPEAVRRARSQLAVDNREMRLLPDADKVSRADYNYVNTGSLAELEGFVRSVMDDLTG